MDGEQALQDRIPIVFAADQPPFSIASHRFCVLQPLMTLEGERLLSNAGQFPNRGRVWWMLHDKVREDHVVPGSIWTAPIEHAKQWDQASPDQDRYQAKIHEIQPGGHDLIEVISLEENVPDLGYVQRGKLLSWPRPTPQMVMLRGREKVLGPLLAKWNAQTRQLEFQALSVGNPEVLCIPLDAFDATAQLQWFDFEVGQVDPKSEVLPMKLCLTRKEWLNYDKLRPLGEAIDASTDRSVVTWAIKQCKLSRSEANPIKNLITKLDEVGGHEVEESVLQGKIARLRAISTDVQRVFDLGEEVAKQLGDSSPFENLVSQHAHAITHQRVQHEIEQRREEILKATKQEQQQLEAVRRELAQLSKELERKLAAQEEELHARLGDRIKGLEKQEQRVAEKERSLMEQEQTLQQRLERVIGVYQSEAEKLGDDLIAQLPILGRLGGGHAAGNGAASAGAAPVCELPLPYYVREGHPRKGDCGDEEQFITQFDRYVQRRGFRFQRSDLINFHTCVKIGALTVLAGPSGTGKSSLPQLYAEALGCGERYHSVPVRPDWLDDRDFVGAFNPLAQRFEPANSGIVEKLIAAVVDRQKELGGIYILCLDEMNLARVEHYFAQFLSVLENPEGRRYISLFAPGMAQANDPYLPYRELELAHNVRFVGTVNIDETTHFFSPKVLDRAQVVSLPQPDLTQLTGSSVAEAGPGSAVATPVSLETFRSWRKPIPQESAARELILQVAEIMQKARLGLGARQYQRMLQYVASAQPLLSEDEALDYQFKQVVLPRLRRTSPAFETAVEALSQLLPAVRFPRTAELLERMAEPGFEHEYFQLL